MPLDPPVVCVHVHARTGSAPSTAPSSVGRPGRGGGGGGAVVSAGMGPGHLYRPYVPPHRIRRGCCLSLFVAINALTVLSALSVAVAEILSIVYHRLSRTFVYVCAGSVGTAQSDGRIHPAHTPPHTHPLSHTTAQAIAIRVYGVALSFLVVFAELGWTKAVRDTPLLQNWASRGAIYALYVPVRFSSWWWWSWRMLWLVSCRRVLDG